jgi:DNA-binding PadR family transcriptional regulator
MSPKTSNPLTVELALLGYLSPGPLHGYQIYQRLHAPDGPGLVWRLKQAQLYAILGKLEEIGFVRSRLQPQEKRPTRHVYQLTSEGRDALDAWLVTPVNTPRQVRQEFMLKLYFARRENEQLAATLVASQVSVCERWLEAQAEEYNSAHPGSFNRAVYQYRLGQIQAALTWLQQLC